jgi:hypothetical protein
LRAAWPFVVARGVVEAVVGGSDGSTRVQFSPPHKNPRKQPCTRRVFESSRLMLAE